MSWCLFFLNSEKSIDLWLWGKYAVVGKSYWTDANCKAPGSSPHRRCRPRTWTWSCMCARPLTLSRCLASTRVLSASPCCSRSSSSSRPTSQPARSSKSGERLKVVAFSRRVAYLTHRLKIMTNSLARWDDAKLDRQTEHGYDCSTDLRYLWK